MLKDKLAKKLAEQGGKITRNMLASKAGVSQASFSQIATGAVKNPGVYTIAKIAKCLDCTVDELIGRDGYVLKKITAQAEHVEFDPDLALSCAMAVLDALSYAREEDISFENLLAMIATVYKYSIGKNSKKVDEYFAKWFVQNFMDAKKDAL